MPTHLATIIDGKRVVHMAGHPISDYDTACGIDMNDPLLGHHMNNASTTREPIDCAQCFSIWKQARTFKPKEFLGRYISS